MLPPIRAEENSVSPTAKLRYLLGCTVVNTTHCPLVALPFTFRHPGSIHLVASNHHATPQIALTLLPMGRRSAGAAPDENEVKKQSRRSYHKFINRNTNCSSHHTEQPPIFEITVHSRCQYAAMLPRGPRRRDQPTWFKHEE